MRAFVGSMVSWGLTDACVSPGSRSTPLALALARDERIRVHVHLDERAASFFALGLAKATGRPTAVACTSGTAAAEHLPAVVEASMSRVPLVVLTADRPPELRGVGANQTIDQVGLYGEYVSWSVDAEVPGERPEVGYWYGLGSDAWAASLRHPPGPVHVNLPFREPLVPGGGPADLGGLAGAFADMTFPPPRPSRADVEALADLVGSTERGMVLAGTLRGAAPSVLELCDRAGWPLVAEPTSGLRVAGALEAGQFLLADEGFVAAHRPEIVLQLGAAPTSRAALQLVATAGRLVIADPDDLVADPFRRADPRMVVDVEELATGASRLVEPRGETSWVSAWREADRRARRAVDALMDGWSEPYEGRVARDLAAGAPDGATLVVASSMPVRDLDACMRPRDGLRVLANRGASGIDGFVSTVLGVSAAGAPTLALCGDLSLLHDAGSLLWSAGRGYDAVLAVPNDDGGAIFSHLPQRDLPELEALFTTPHGLELGAVARAAGAGHALVVHADDLVPAVDRALAAGGVWLVEVPIDRERDVARHAGVRAAVTAALRG
jgi:2-succinyl-5-enolpyruvyl-6-hydroxy-3-cyclohexene-1-carboxylate synthase